MIFILAKKVKNGEIVRKQEKTEISRARAYYSVKNVNRLKWPKIGFDKKRLEDYDRFIG